MREISRNKIVAHMRTRWIRRRKMGSYQHHHRLKSCRKMRESYAQRRRHERNSNKGHDDHNRHAMPSNEIATTASTMWQSEWLYVSTSFCCPNEAS
mmetsp:Transcript_3299/g.5121  ORF Transcript_3299/g.5121 Transcript_3299/m.5121 type:complete len:96 (+) Transcript_3299:611-898(+)